MRKHTECSKPHLVDRVDAHIATLLAKFVVGRAALFEFNAGFAACFPNCVAGRAAVIVDQAEITTLNIAVSAGCGREGQRRLVSAKLTSCKRAVEACGLIAQLAVVWARKHAR